MIIHLIDRQRSFVSMNPFVVTQLTRVQLEETALVPSDLDTRIEYHPPWQIAKCYARGHGSAKVPIHSHLGETSQHNVIKGYNAIHVRELGPHQRLGNRQQIGVR